jgi:hypothetical protein
MRCQRGFDLAVSMEQTVSAYLCEYLIGLVRQALLLQDDRQAVGRVDVKVVAVEDCVEVVLCLRVRVGSADNSYEAQVALTLVVEDLRALQEDVGELEDGVVVVLVLRTHNLVLLLGRTPLAQIKVAVPNGSPRLRVRSITSAKKKEKKRKKKTLHTSDAICWSGDPVLFSTASMASVYQPCAPRVSPCALWMRPRR